MPPACAVRSAAAPHVRAAAAVLHPALTGLRAQSPDKPQTAAGVRENTDDLRRQRLRPVHDEPRQSRRQRHRGVKDEWAAKHREISRRIEHEDLHGLRK